ncbi:MAG: YhdP family protein, partial [Hafnia alvei]|nr:YhdP family protein [Hafnia alvei]
GSATFINNDKGWSLSGDNLDVQAKSLWATGEFKYQHPKEGQPWLSILSGIRLYDAAQAWRYFPEPLMGTHLVDYLTGALEGGKVDNATLVYAGNPHYFPYLHNEGQFQVFVPLRDATFRFQPNWEPLNNLAIDLNFLNDGLWMNAPHTKLGDVDGTDITAVIPVYQKEKLLVDAKVAGSGKAVHEYFKTSPLADSVGAALDELEVGGDVSGRLHLDIPLDGKETRATGDVAFKNNSLLIKPLDSTFTQLNGSLHFDNGNLTSSPMNAAWFGQPVNFTFSTAEGAQDFGVDVALNADWQPAKLPWMPSALAKDVAGSAPWNTKVAIKLPHKGHPSYDVQVNADLKNVSSHLPSPLDKPHGQALPLVVNAKGDLNGFMLTGNLGPKNHFNSQIILQKHGVKLARAAWSDNSRKIPALPESESLTLNLPALDGEEWLAALAPALGEKAGSGASNFSYPQQVNLTTPQLILAGQTWHQLTVSASKLANGTHISAKGREVNGEADLDNNNVLRANVAYLYYNPQWSSVSPSAASSANSDAPAAPPAVERVSFSQWPSMILRCQDCWMMGQRLRQVNADLTPNGDQLMLKNGLIDTGNTKVTLSGMWNQSNSKDHTWLKVQVKGANITTSSDYFGFSSPLKNSPFDVHLDLNWIGEPWRPQVNSLNGTLSSKLGKGEIDNAGGGRAGQLLRLVSFDALLRKLKLDFSDTFGQGFYYDSIRGNGKFKDGILSTNDLLVDGLAADIAMDGNVNLVTRRIDMQAVIAPEISATVGVATAFVINPVVGAAVFAASRVLAPLWNKISLIRYNITGSLDHPTINEVLRQPKEK